MAVPGDLVERWTVFRDERFAVLGLPDDTPFDEADWALLHSEVAGYIDRAVTAGGLTADEAHKVQQLAEEIRRWLWTLTADTGQLQMATLAELAEVARHWRR